MTLRIFLCLLLLTSGYTVGHSQSDTCDAFYHGANHRFAGRWSEAIAELTKAIDQKCELGRAYLLRGEARWGAKDYDGAWADATKAIPLLDEPALGHRLRGQLAFARTDFKTALTEFTKSIELDPDVRVTHAYRAETRVELGDEEGAVSDYAKVLALGGEDVPENYLARAKAHLMKRSFSAHYTKGTELYHERKNTDAIASFTKAIAEDPKRPEYLTARAKVNILLRKLPAALLDLDRSIALGGTHEAYALRANIYIERGKYDTAAADLERAVQLSKGLPDDIALLYNEAVLAGVHGLLGKASAFRSHRDTETRNYYFYNSLYDDALNDKSSGFYGLALARFNAATAHFPDKIEFLAESGLVWIELGKPKDALADFDRALVIKPKMFYIQIYRGRALNQMKRYADAIAAADIAIDRMAIDDPVRTEAYEVRAAANCALGRKIEAGLDEEIFKGLGGEIKAPCR